MRGDPLNKKLPVIMYIGVAVLLIVLFGMILLLYSRPMQDVTLDLSLVNHTAAATPYSDDEKGWEVYTREGDVITELEYNGRGSYAGLELSQTFYLSRVLSEELDNPTLQLGAFSKTYVVWLDDEVLYTDFPEEDNRIGYLKLPMREYSRQDPIIITIPHDYQGKTLTIAQSTPPYTETGTVLATPTTIILYCGYAYESSLISESYTLAIAATALFVIGVLLLIGCLRPRNGSMVCLALTAFFGMCSILLNASFRHRYYTSSLDLLIYLRWASALTMLIFLTLKAGTHKKPVQFLTSAALLLTPVSLILSSVYPTTIHPVLNFLKYDSLEYTFLFTLAGILVCGMLFWRKEKRFYRLFTPLTLAGMVIYWILFLLLREDAVQSLTHGFTFLAYYGCLIVTMAATLITALWDTVRTEWETYMERQLIENHREMAVSGYMALRRQHEEIMKLRHDMADQLRTLKAITDHTRAVEYIESLIGKQEKIRPVVQTGNEMLDIMLNGKLSEAQDAGITLDIVKAEAPETLPISDTDICSLVMNIMNNAVKAAGVAGAVLPFIRLNIHVKNNYFAITCQNSADTPRREQEDKKEKTVREHGLGLKIIEEITEKYNGMLKTSQADGTFEIRIAIPLETPRQSGNITV